MIAIECKDVTKSFGEEVALNQVSFKLESGNIYALLGRNGAGKTTLMNCLCTKYLPDSGEIRMLEERAYENEEVLNKICFMSDYIDAFEPKNVKFIIDYASAFYENWNNELMNKLLDFFEINLKKTYGQLSKGQQTVMGIIIGLCSGCEIVLLDEIYSGLDAVARQDFYKILLEEQDRNPRTFLISTHLIEEMTGLFTNVVMMDKGKIILNEDMEGIHEKSFKCTGRPDKAAYLYKKNVLCEKKMGTIAEYNIYDTLTMEERKQLEEDGFSVSSLSLQELFIALTADSSEEWGGAGWK